MTGAASRPDRVTVAAFLAMTVMASANAVGVRFTIQELAPFWGAALRFFIAGLIMAIVMIGSRRALPRGEHLVGSLIYGALNFGLSYVFLYTALRDAGAGTAMVILSIVPLLTLLLAVAHGIEPLRRLGLLGAVIAAGGIVLVFGDQASLAVPAVALLALLAGAISIAESGVLIKRFPPGDPISANAIGMLLGASLLLGLSLITGERQALPVRTETWLATGYLVVFGSVAVFMLVLYVLERWTASAVSYTFLLAPLIAIPLGAVLLGETVRPTFLIGGAIVLVGVYVGAFFHPRRVRPGEVARPLPQAVPSAAVPVEVQPPCP
jgi:drug/metabolite transporter (DMT)-like permease